MRSTGEIFNFLVRNAEYYIVKYTEEEMQEIAQTYVSGDDNISLPCIFEHIPGFHVDFDKFTSFLGEKYNYKKHIEPLVKQGLIYTADGIESDICMDYDT